MRAWTEQNPEFWRYIFVAHFQNSSNKNSFVSLFSYLQLSLSLSLSEFTAFFLASESSLMGASAGEDVWELISKDRRSLKHVRDNVHGNIYLEPVCIVFSESPLPCFHAFSAFASRNLPFPFRFPYWFSLCRAEEIQLLICLLNWFRLGDSSATSAT